MSEHKITDKKVPMHLHDGRTRVLQALVRMHGFSIERPGCDISSHQDLTKFEDNQQPEEPATVVRDPPPIHRGNICISNVIGFIPVFAEAAAIAIYVFFSTPLLPDRAVVAAAVVLG
ncbi:hypothetical protein AU210_016048 [Fusarium oxysporum f. sp. radicis-cucumerinum]|uniref:Uncharacterized protein n=1 Tax=Fusarium oxysporum f. sp. radicis-cucumerinum TaxID=327505 RepID=A0A2H3G384_FUSOX|nr:hypothetical protein AU210_016048 [Fusarium oxysporum f. sp. radicis-cucumerinum]